MQANVPLCNPSGQPGGNGRTQLYHGVNAGARCGELVITAANGKQSIDTVTVTIGGKAPTYVHGENPSNNALQTAIDNATPGDLIMVDPGTYTEMVLMWKPVRLQGVGAASTIINGNTHPAGKIDTWRRQVECLFGLSLNGGPISGTNPYDPSGAFTCPLVDADESGSDSAGTVAELGSHTQRQPRRALAGTHADGSL